MSESLEQARQAFVRGIALFEGEQYESADEAFTQALALAPGRASVLLNLGVTKVHRQLFEQAEPLLQAALAADDTQGDGWAALGLALLFGVYRFMSMAIATCNTIGNSVATVVVAKWAGEFSEQTAKEEYERVLGRRAAPAL